MSAVVVSRCQPPITCGWPRQKRMLLASAHADWPTLEGGVVDDHAWRDLKGEFHQVQANAIVPLHLVSFAVGLAKPALPAPLVTFVPAIPAPLVDANPVAADEVGVAPRRRAPAPGKLTLVLPRPPPPAARLVDVPNVPFTTVELPPAIPLLFPLPAPPAPPAPTV